MTSHDHPAAGWRIWQFMRTVLLAVALAEGVVVALVVGLGAVLVIVMMPFALLAEVFGQVSVIRFYGQVLGGLHHAPIARIAQALALWLPLVGAVAGSVHGWRRDRAEMSTTRPES